MCKSVTLRAFGKANLSLNITGKNDDSGLHELDSVMVSLDCFDTVTVTERSDGEITVTFDNADIGADNTAYRAARAVRDILGEGGWDITVHKGIPMGAGLGGSSADGAAVLRALDLFYRLPTRGVDMRAVALSVGSDVPFMLTGGLARVTGVGDKMFFIDNKLPLFAIGLMAGECSTKQVYAEYDRLYGDKPHCPTDTDALCNLLLGGELSATKHFGNALYAPAAAVLPQIKECKARLEETGAVVNMTGSGGMVLGYFTDITALSDALDRLGDKSARVFTTARTGILHEWSKTN